MNITLEYRPDVVAAARASYAKAELVLEYALEQRPVKHGRDTQEKVESALRIRPNTWLGIADTLVMVFSAPDADLVAMDAYTNMNRWSRVVELPLPNVVGEGRVCLANPPRDTDRIDFGVVPRFQYCEAQARLRITLRGRADQHYRVSTCLIVGTDGAGIASLDFSNLRVEG